MLHGKCSATDGAFVDSENASTQPGADRRRATLAQLAEYLLTQEAVVTGQWLLAVRRDTQIDSSDRLTYRQLLDRLPQIYRDCCEFVRRRDAGLLAGETRSDAREHGGVRWQEGYQLDELLRELEAFRRIVVLVTTRYADLNGDFQGEIHNSAHALIQQFFSEVTIQSVRQFVSEQRNVVGDYTQKLKSANLELAATNADLQQALSERQRLTRVVAHELRNFLQCLGHASTAWDRCDALTRGQQEASAQIKDMERLLTQLLQHCELIASDDPLAISEFDPRELQKEIVRDHEDGAGHKKLHFTCEGEEMPTSVCGDRAKIKQLVVNLLSNAIKFTSQGEVGLVFGRHDSQRWMIRVSDSGPGLPEGAAQRLFDIAGPTPEDVPGRGAGLAIAKDLVDMLGGSLQVVTRAGSGTRIEVFLPRDCVKKAKGVSPEEQAEGRVDIRPSAAGK